MMICYSERSSITLYLFLLPAITAFFCTHKDIGMIFNFVFRQEIFHKKKKKREKEKKKEHNSGNFLAVNFMLREIKKCHN